MIETIGQAVAEVADTITAAFAGGQVCTTDTRNLQLPGALLAPRAIDFDTLAAEDYTLTCDLFLVSRDQGTPNALLALGEMLTACRSVFTVDTARAVTIGLANHGSDPLPALQITLVLQVQGGPVGPIEGNVQ